ncbi:hypothetical protein [uncultured Sphingomonas sp.]|uniref:hypothetical protein n=1 Tax=uncultured Sphingomonas sp. TaxID=158754 RepID=UPI00260B6B62|nr:hypothetical protein [uncultured Sphingomonas sp.]
MTADEFRALAIQHLDRCDEADMEALASEQPNADLFIDLFSRYQHARQAFPGMTWEEFSQIDAARERRGRRGRPNRASEERADEPLWRAARDADRLKSLWRSLNPATPRPRPPLHPHQIAAARHGVNRQALDDQMRRPTARRMDRITAQK